MRSMGLPPACLVRYIHIAETMGKAVDLTEQNATLEDLFCNVFGIMPPPVYFNSEQVKE